MSSPYIAQYYANGQWNYMYGVSHWSNTSERSTIDNLKKEIARKKLKPGTDVMLTETATGNVVWSTTIPEPIVVQAESNNTASYTPRYSGNYSNTSIPSSNVSSEGSAGSALMGLVFIGIIGWAIWNYGISGLGDMFNRFNAVQYTADSVSDFADHINTKGYCTVSPDHEKCNPAAYTGDYYADGFIVKLGNAEAFIYNGEAEITGISGTKIVPLNKAVGTILTMQ